MKLKKERLLRDVEKLDEYAIRILESIIDDIKQGNYNVTMCNEEIRDRAYTAHIGMLMPLTDDRGVQIDITEIR